MKWDLEHLRGAATIAVAAGFVATVPALVQAAEVPKSPEVAETGTLTIANTMDYAPFEYLDADGKQVGINVELAAEAARLMDVKLDIVRIPFPSMIPGIDAGRFKIAWETFSATPERLQVVDFVMFIKAGIVASTTPDKEASFQGENNLCGKRIGVAPGTVADLIADRLNQECKDKGLPEIQKSVFNAASDIINAVLSDRIDARLDDATSSSYFEVTSNRQLVVAPGLYDVAPLGIAVKKGDKETAEMLRVALEEMRTSGFYKATLDKYGMGNYVLDEIYVVDSEDKIRK